MRVNISPNLLVTWVIATMRDLGNRFGGSVVMITTILREDRY